MDCGYFDTTRNGNHSSFLTPTPLLLTHDFWSAPDYRPIYAFDIISAVSHVSLTAVLAALCWAMQSHQTWITQYLWQPQQCYQMTVAYVADSFALKSETDPVGYVISCWTKECFNTCTSIVSMIHCRHTKIMFSLHASHYSVVCT